MDFELNSEVADALVGFLKDDDPSLHSVDILLQNDNMGGCIQQQPPPLVDPSAMACCSARSLLSSQDKEKLELVIRRLDFELNSEVTDALIGFLNDDDPALHSIDVFLQSDFMGGYIQQQPPPLFEPNVDPSTMAGCSARSLSTQSVAARKRRKKISQRTQELARLIPGGIKKNTADMFEAAYEYIKFLQAQIGILQTMASTLECRSSKEEEYLHILLSSMAIQEKLAAEGMCILPSYVTRP